MPSQAFGWHAFALRSLWPDGTLGVLLMTEAAGIDMHQTETAAADQYKRLYEEALEKIAALEALVASLGKENHNLRLRDVPLPNSGHEWLQNLQYKVKSLAGRVAGFESGEKYTQMWAEFNTQLAKKDREIKSLKKELADANSQIVTVRKNWSEIFDDMEKQHKKELDEKDRALKKMEERALNAERRVDETKDKLLEKTREAYEVQTELEDVKGKNQALKAQINRNHENSSKPSSTTPNRKKITNSREPSGKSPGGQPGHEHHPRKMHVPTNKIEIPGPAEYADSPDYELTGNTIVKQLVDIRVEVITNEYSTPEYRNIRTGVRVHAEFPGDLFLDVTYGGSIKAFAFLLNNYCNVSIGKVQEIISELTRGELVISTGMINGLSKEFSEKTEAEQNKAFADILLSPVMHVDFTRATVNGKKVSVLVCATPDSEHVLYFAKERQGHEGIKDTPVETYRGKMVHDHDLTFYCYGDAHQECNDHVVRYLKGSTENEPKLTWNERMLNLVRETIHWRKHLDPKDERNPDEIDPERVAGFEASYDEILKQAKDEYDYEPPGKYNKKGFNLYRRLEKYKKEHLLFLHDRKVSYSNSLAERLLRVFKRKQHQVMAFRSFGSLEQLCNALGAIARLRGQGKNLYESVSAIFDRPLEKKEKEEKLAS